MATKKEIYEEILLSIDTFVINNNIEHLREDLREIITEHLAPKMRGRKTSEAVKVDEHGNIVQMQCSASRVWLPATLEYFYEDKSDNPKIVTADGIGLKRVSRQATKIYKKFTVGKASDRLALTNELLATPMDEENIERVTAIKRELEAIEERKPDYSSVGL